MVGIALIACGWRVCVYVRRLVFVVPLRIDRWFNLLSAVARSLAPKKCDQLLAAVPVDNFSIWVRSNFESNIGGLDISK